MRVLFAAGFCLLLIANAVADEPDTDTSLFDRNSAALDRAEQRQNVGPADNAGGRTGYVERGHDNNTGNDAQSQQLDRLDREPDH